MQPMKFLVFATSFLVASFCEARSPGRQSRKMPTSCSSAVACTRRRQNYRLVRSMNLRFRFLQFERDAELEIYRRACG